MPQPIYYFPFDLYSKIVEYNTKLHVFIFLDIFNYSVYVCSINETIIINEFVNLFPDLQFIHYFCFINSKLVNQNKMLLLIHQGKVLQN